MKHTFFYLTLVSLLMTACTSPDVKKEKTLGKEALSKRERKEAKIGGTILGESLFTTDKSSKNETSGIGVNSYLWKASLDAVSFLPKKSIDPFGGTILTDWYSPIETPKERLKVEIIIMGRELKSDAIKVSIFRQKKNTKNEWQDQAVDPKTVLQFEETILTRARELKVSEEK